jgi:hypothetical protein
MSYGLHLQGIMVKIKVIRFSETLVTANKALRHNLEDFYPEDGESIFLRNAGKPPERPYGVYEAGSPYLEVFCPIHSLMICLVLVRRDPLTMEI